MPDKSQERARVHLTAFDRLSALSFKVFGRQGRSLSRLMPQLKDGIMKSNLRITPEGLVSLVLFSTVLSIAAAAACLLVAVALGNVYIAFGAIAPPIVFIIVFNAPKISQGSRSSALDNEFPFVIGFMEVLAGGGVSPISALRRISRMDKIFPAASKEAKTILVDIDVFGLDPITAFERAAQHSPNRPFKEFLYGYTTVLKTGGDVAHYVNGKLKETFDSRSTKIKRTSDSIGTIAEAYLTVTSVLGISLFTLYQVQGIVSHNPQGLQSLFVFSYLVIPLVSGLFIYILDGMQPKQPHIDMRPYKAFAASIPLAVAVYLAPVALDLPLHVSLALASAVIAPAVLASKYGRETKAMEKALPDFIRDVAEGRKVGLAPEGSIEQLASKNYGRLSKAIKKMASQISWGLPIAKVVSSFAADVNSWITKVIGTLMVEVVDVGGGTVRSFSEMADFTRKVNDIEADKRAALRPYVFVTYMSGLMLVLTTFLMVFFLSQPITTAYSTVPGVSASGNLAVVGQLLMAAIFDSWIVGFVAGKMGEGAVAEGFKHSLLLVLLSIVTIYIASSFIAIKF